MREIQVTPETFRSLMPGQRIKLRPLQGREWDFEVVEWLNNRNTLRVVWRNPYGAIYHLLDETHAPYLTLVVPDTRPWWERWFK